MTFLYILEALGGLGLFILGMKTMSEGLQKIAGERFRRLLERVAGNRLAAALLGSSLSSLLQSSSAACIITVGFVNAGLISLYQALGILLGTGIGTTVAVQFIAFKITSFALPAIFIGVGLRFFVRRRRWVNAGELILGAGLLFLGLRVMEANLLPLQQNAIIFSHESLLIPKHLSALLFGALLTFLVQSGSTAIGIVMALAGSGLVTFETGAAMVIGELIGTSVITAVASIGGTLEAKRTVFFFFVINLVAATVVMFFFPSFTTLVSAVSPADPATSAGVSRLLANTHTAFSILNACLFLPLIGFFARSAPHLLPGSERSTNVEPRTIFIDARVINTPTIALLQARNELRRMADITRTMYVEMVEQFFRYDAKKASGIGQKENAIDILQRDISDFLVAISRQPLPPEDSMDIPIMLQLMGELEHVADQTDAVLGYLRRKKEEKLLFSSVAMTEIRNLARKVEEMVVLAIESMETTSVESMARGGELRAEVARMREVMLNGHIKRLSTGKCTVRAGIIYADILSAFAKIADSCFTIIETRKEFV
ncbi:MAG: Na/Pi cotransporter family protein [Desulfuromonadales bacterium]|nr:MAG: Na/Pi cotransporter family protein [Desulfuromonadales bacterium]